MLTKDLNFKSDLAKKDYLDAVINAPNIANFNDNFFKDKALKHYLHPIKTLFTSQATKYLSFGGLRENISFINLVTNGCCPTTTRSKGIEKKKLLNNELRSFDIVYPGEIDLPGSLKYVLLL